jgi:hypothetical protein
MEIVTGKPAEMINTDPWLGFLAALLMDGDPVLPLLRGEPVRLLLHGPSQLVVASEWNLDLLRVIATSVSGRFAGGLDDDLPEPAIRYHPSLHRCDFARLNAVAERDQSCSFLVVGMDCTMAAPGWSNVALAPGAALPHPALAFLRWLHSEWNLSDVEPRLEVISRWARAGEPAKLKVVTP